MPEFKLVRKFNEKGDTTERKIEVKIKDKVRRINTRKKKQTLHWDTDIMGLEGIVVETHDSRYSTDKK